MIYRPDPPDGEWAGYEWTQEGAPYPTDYTEPAEEPPYPQGTVWKPLVIGVAIVLTLMCWGLAYVSTNLVWALIFGAIVPFVVWVIGMRMVRGSKKHAEEVDSKRTTQGLEGLTGEIPKSITKHLLPFEDVWFARRKHPITILGKKHPWVGGLIAFTMAIVAAVMLRVGLPLVAGSIALLALVVLALRVLIWHDEWFLVTNKRVMWKHGLIKREVRMIPRSKVTDVESKIPPLARILAWLRIIQVPYGHVRIEAADNNDRKSEEGKSNITYLPGSELVGGLILAKE